MSNQKNQEQLRAKTENNMFLGDSDNRTLTKKTPEHATTRRSATIRGIRRVKRERRGELMKWVWRRV